MSIGWILIQLVHYLASAINLFVLVWVVLSWVPIDPYSRFKLAVDEIGEMLFGWLRHLLPRMVTSPLDFTPLIVIFGVSILEGLLTRIIAALFMGGGL